MAKEHKELQELPPRSSQRFEEKYPNLSKWLNGSVWELEPKVDFKVSTETFYQSFRGYLDRSGIKAELGQRGKNVWVKARRSASHQSEQRRTSRTRKTKAKRSTR